MLISLMPVISSCASLTTKNLAYRTPNMQNEWLRGSHLAVILAVLREKRRRWSLAGKALPKVAKCLIITFAVYLY